MMNFFKTDAEVKIGKAHSERAAYVRSGGTLDVFKAEDILDLQTYALDIKDIQLYDYLDKFWVGIRASHAHRFELVDCARPMICGCGEVRS